MNRPFFRSITLMLGFTLLLHPFLDLKHLLFEFDSKSMLEIYDMEQREANSRTVFIIDTFTQTIIPLIIACIVVQTTQIAQQARDKAALYLIAGASIVILCKHFAPFQDAFVVDNRPITYCDFIGYPLLLIGVFRLLFTLAPCDDATSDKPITAPFGYAVVVTLGLAYAIAKTLQHTNETIMSEWLSIPLAIIIAGILVRQTQLRRRIRSDIDVLWIAFAIGGSLIVALGSWLPFQFFDSFHQKPTALLDTILRVYAIVNLISRIMLGTALLHLLLTLAPSSLRSVAALRS